MNHVPGFHEHLLSLLLDEGVKSGFPQGDSLIEAKFWIFIELVIGGVIQVGLIIELVSVDGGHFLPGLFGCFLGEVLLLKIMGKGTFLEVELALSEARVDLMDKVRV